MHSKNRQTQTIADIIGGCAPLLDPQALTDPFDWILEQVQIEMDHGTRIPSFLIALRAQNPELGSLIDDIIMAEPGYRKRYRPLSEIETPPIEFMWEGWIPRGEMTLLAAAPGAGKTYMLLDLFGRIIHDTAAPDGQTFDLPANANNSVVLVDAENYLPAIKERIAAWGINIDRFYPMEKPVRGLIDLADPYYQDDLMDMIDELKPALVAVDSLSRINQRGENNIEDLREVLDFLSELPDWYGCGLILVHHLRKRPSRYHHRPVSVDDIRGTGDLIAAARSIIAIDPIKSNKNARRVTNIKINEGERPDPLAFMLVSMEQNPRIARLEYKSLADLDPVKPTKVELCAEWLRAILSEGPLPFREIASEANHAGYKINVLLDAKKQLYVIDTVGARRKGNEWALPEEGGV